MSAAHKARWEKNRERYAEAAVRSAASRRGMKYRLPRRSVFYNQYGIQYKSIKEICAQHNLIERLVRLVLEGKRMSTGGLSFVRSSPRYETDRKRHLENRKHHLEET